MKGRRQYIIPIFVSHRGCPHDCIFCNQKKITGQVGDCTAEQVEKTICEHLATISKGNSIIDVAFYGGSFTAIPMFQQNELLKVAYEYIKKGQINSIRLSTRPDCISEEILENLKNYGVSTIELGVQSMDDEILALCHRGHTSSDVVEAVHMIKKYSFNVGVQVMVGLPGDTKEKSIDTVKKLIAMKPDIARIYPALVIKNTYLENMFYRKEYSPLSLYEAVDICKSLLILFEKNRVNVIRVGLQATENIAFDKDIVAGPFHPSMRQLVESSIYRDMIELLLDRISCKIERKKINHVNIFVNSRDISNIIGQKKSNIKYLSENFFIKKIAIIPKNAVESGVIVVQYDENELMMSKNDYINASII